MILSVRLLERNINMFESFQNNALNFEQHKDSVGQFLDHFNIKTQKPHLHFLQEIISHYAQIPYENISKIIKLKHHWDEWQKIRLPEEVIDGHVSFKLGGTCFSLTYFLQTILRQNGFTCYPVMADMRAGKNIHCSIVVVLDNTKYLIDPGYLLNQPMEIQPQKPRLYRTEHSGVELLFNRRTGYFELFTFNQSQTKWRYQFKDRPCPPEEFLQHWFASFQKPTMHGICLTKITQEGLIYVHKNYLRETTFTGKRSTKIKKNYHATIHRIFGIDAQLIEEAQAALQDNLAKERELGIFVPKKKTEIS